MTSDHQVIKMLKGWAEDHTALPSINSTNLYDALLNEKELAEQLQHFVGLILDGTEIRALATFLFNECLNRHNRLATEDLCPGFIELWRPSLRHPVDSHNVWLVQEVSKALQISMRFSNSIYYYWKANDRTLKPDPASREQIVDFAKKMLSNDPELFNRIIDAHHMYSCYHFSVLFTEEITGRETFEGLDWKWFGNAMIHAAIISPAIMVPQIVSLVVNVERDWKECIYTVQRKSILTMFSGNYDNLVDVLNCNFNISEYQIHEQEQIQYAKTESFRENLMGVVG